MKRSTALTAALPLLISCAMAQTFPKGTLADFVDSMHWDPAARGPLMVLEPESVTAKAGVKGLSAFGMMLTKAQGLSAIVPDTMVVIDDSMLQPPNLYDGLPRHSKVLYLLTTLTSQQWDAITGSGLGVADLTADQRAVFTSIMPKPFTYSTYTVTSGDNLDPVDKDVVVSDSDWGLIRLHVERSLQFMMPLVGDTNSVSPRLTRDHEGKPGDKVVERDSGQDFHTQTSFGVAIKQTVANQLKPAALDYASPKLSGVIPLNSSESIADLLKRIGRTTALEFHADFRVGDRKIVSYGQSAPISSLLKMIALSVTGTYRKVGSAFMLTSDLTGMGARKLVLAAYDQQLNSKLWNQEAAWRQQIYKSGHLGQIRFRADDRLQPGDALMKKLDLGNRDAAAKISASDLTDSLREFVQHQNEIYNTQQVTAEGATVESAYEFSYILPSGDNTRPDFDALGQHELFSTSTGRVQPPQQPPDIPKVKVAAIKDPVFLCISADTAANAQRAVELATAYGFKELWLDTLSAEALSAALAAAATTPIKISLAIRPFDYRGAADNASADRTLFGDAPPESLARRMASPDWAGILAKGIRPPEPLGPISPLSTGYAARQKAAIALAATPGLAGVHVLSPTPQGYNGPRVNYLSFPQPMFFEEGNFGYAEDVRLAFIRERSIDPIDLCPPSIRTNSDLRQPFFLDDALRGSTSVYDGSDEPNPAMATIMADFDRWLAKLNHSCLTALLEPIAKAHPNLPISMEGIPVAMNAVNRFGAGLVGWKLGDPLPEFSEGSGGAQADFAKYVQRATVTEEGAPYAKAILSYMGQDSANQLHLAGLVLDLTSLPPTKAEKWLAETLVSSPPKR
jgi:hypothetical protein